MSDEDVIVRIGTDAFTVRDYREGLAFRLELLKRKLGKTFDREKEDQARKRVGDQLLRQTFATLAYRALAKESAVTVPSEISHRVNVRYQKTFCKGNEELKDLSKAFSSDALYRRFTAEMEMEKLTDAYLQKFHRDVCVVSNEVLEAELARVRRENLEADVTNAFIYATASNVWRQAAGGADFARLADRYTQEGGAEPGGDLGNCDRTDFAAEDNPEVWETISKLKTGDVTPPMSTIEGLAIYKCIEKVASEDHEGGEAWHLARICFHRALKYPPYEREEMREILLAKNKKACVSRLVSDFYKTTPVDFPNGLAFLPKSVRPAALQIARLSNAAIQGKTFNELLKEEQARKAAQTNAPPAVVRPPVVTNMSNTSEKTKGKQ